MALQFPNSPTNGQVYVEPTTGNRYVYNAAHVRWDFAANAASIFANDSQLLFTTSRIVTGANGAYYDSTSNTVYFNTVNASANIVAQYFIGNGAALTGIVTDFSPAFVKANGAFTVANAAFNAANNAVTDFSPAFLVANAAFGQANTTYTFGNNIYAAVNSVFGVANAAYGSANNVAPQVAPAFNTANAAYNFANTINTFAYGVAVNAEAAFAAANNVAPQVTPAFNTANAAYLNSNGAFAKANAALANTSGVYFGGDLWFPSGNVGIGITSTTYPLHINRSQDGVTSAVISNYTVGYNATAGFILVGGTLNSSLETNLYDYNGSPYATFKTGSAVTGLYFDAAQHTFRNVSGTVSYLTLGSTGGTLNGDLVVTGNLTTSGTVTYANTQTLLIGDSVLTLNADIPNSIAPTENAGIEVGRGSSSNVSLLWNENSDKWTFTNDGTTYKVIASNTDVESANNYSGAMANASNAYAESVGVSTNAYATATYSTIVQWSSSFGVTNAAFGVANAAFTYANNMGYFSGNNGDKGNATGLGDIFRVHSNTLTQNVTIYSGNNASCAGPIAVALGKTLTIQTGARVAIV